MNTSQTMTQEAYSVGSRSAITQFIRDATRHETGDIAFRDESTLDVIVEVGVAHQLVCRLTTDTEKGRVSPGFTDLIAQSESEQQSNCHDLAHQALADFDVQGELKTGVQSHAYGHHKDETYLGSFRKKAFFNYTCGTCTGTGEVSCGSCGGDGRQSCNFCGGSGSTSETRWVTDHNGHSTTEWHSVSCSWCMGSGSQSCSTCSGSGNVTCSACDGLKSLTDIATQHYYMRSSYRCNSIEPRRKEAEFAILQRTDHLAKLATGIGTIQKRVLAVDALHRCIQETATISFPLYQANVQIQTFEAPVSVYGNTYVMADVGGLVQKIVQPDLVQLRKAIKEIESFDLWSVHQALKVGETLMTHEVHQNMIAVCPKRYLSRADYKSVSTALARALSPNYVEKSLNTLSSLHAQTFAEYEKFGWCLATPPLLLMLVLLTSADHPIWALILLTLGCWGVYKAIHLYTMRCMQKMGGYALCTLLKNEGFKLR